MATRGRFRHLLSEGRIGAMTVKNRMVLTAMGVGFAEPDGHCGDRICSFFEEQARGGAGMINMGVVGVGWPIGSNMPCQVALSDDRFIPGIQRVAARVHRHGARLAVQLHFGGLVAVEDMLAGRPAWTPSVPVPKAGDMLDGFLESELREAPFTRLANVSFKVMTAEDVRQVVQWFADAARRAREAGADGVELHGGHGYLISSFLSAASNRRTDNYGGSLENRARLLTEIIGAIRRSAGNDFPVWCKLDSEEFGQAGGITLADARATARLAEAAGAAAITVTSYHDPSRGVLHSGSHTPDVPGLMVDHATTVRSAVGIPVIAAGRIEPADADRHIGEARYDFVAMGRKLLADPHLPRKLAAGRPAQVRPCIYCYTCISEIYLWRSSRCAVNPDMGFEYQRIHRTSRRKRVAVVGGGPAGMEAARRLSQRGHEVMLIERADRLGGTLRLASLMYRPNEALLRWLLRELDESQTVVRLNTTASTDGLRALGAEVVVVATGARTAACELPGADKPHVLDGDDLRSMLGNGDVDATRRKLDGFAGAVAATAKAAGLTRHLPLARLLTHAWMPLGPRIAIVGGGLVGLELAEFLAERGRAVTVLESSARFGAGLPIVRRWRVLENLRRRSVRLVNGATDVHIGEDLVRARDSGGAVIAVPATHVILALPPQPDLRLASQLEKEGFEVHAIGDCTGVGYLAGAMSAAAEVVARI